MSPLHKACYHGHVEVVKMLIDHKSDVMARDLYGNTPVHMCALGGQVDCLSLVMQAGAELIDRFALHLPNSRIP
jgi:ankyrin repeat protein